MKDGLDLIGFLRLSARVLFHESMNVSIIYLRYACIKSSPPSTIISIQIQEDDPNGISLFLPQDPCHGSHASAMRPGAIMFKAHKK